MNEDKHTPKLDNSKLTPEQRDKLDQWKNDVKQLQTLEDIASMAQDMLGIMDDQQKDPGRKTLIIDHVTGDDFVKILKNMNTALLEFRNQEKVEMPKMDHKPVVDAVGKLEVAISKAIKGIDVKPVVNVDAPQVHLNPTEVDLKGIEKILKTDLPKAFREAMMMMPMPEKDDYSPLLAAWEGISEQLLSIETATRMKPLPGSMKVSNLETIEKELVTNNIKYASFKFDASDAAPMYIGKHEDADASTADASWVIYKFTYSGSDVTAIRKKMGAYDNRASIF